MATWVNGYYRSNGTYVSGHWRSDPYGTGSTSTSYSTSYSSGSSTISRSTSNQISDELNYPSYLSDLSVSDQNSAIRLSFEDFTSTYSVGWDRDATYSTTRDYALLYDTFKVTLTEGATYDIYSHSYFDPFILKVYDASGSTIVANKESNDLTYGTDSISNFVAPYSGEYFISASWDQGAASSNKFVMLSVYEDSDTVPATDPISSPATAPVDLPPTSKAEVNTSPGEHSTAYFLLELSAPLTQDASVVYETRDGSATAGSDYIYTSGTITIGAGGTFAQIAVELVDDDIVENSEEFFLAVTNPTGGIFPDGEVELLASRTIIDNDSIL